MAPSPQPQSKLRAQLAAAGVTAFSAGFMWEAVAQRASATPWWRSPLSVEVDRDVEDSINEANVDAAPSISHSEWLATLAAGGISGAFSKTCMAPLARLTILYQVQALQEPGRQLSTSSMLVGLRQVATQEGLRSLWKGNLATILHRIPYSAVNFSTFEAAKRELEARQTFSGTAGGGEVARRFVAGAASGLVACTAAYPLDLVRTRLAAQRDLKPPPIRRPAGPASSEASSSSSSVPGRSSTATSGARSAAAAAPGFRHYLGMRHALKSIWREEGPRGLYRGLGATLMQVTPSLALNFTLYDSFKAAALRASGASALHATAHQPASPDIMSSSGRGEACASPAQPGAPTSSSSSSRGPAKEQGLGTVASLACAAAAGFVTSTITFPLDVVRRCMQVAPSGPLAGAAVQQQQGTGQPHQRQPLQAGAGAVGLGSTQGAQAGAAPSYMETVRALYARGGARAFYAGIIPEYVKVVPGMAIAFATYEGLKAATGVTTRD